MLRKDKSLCKNWYEAMDEAMQDDRICAEHDLHEEVRGVRSDPEQEHEELLFAGWKRIFPSLTDPLLPFTVHEPIDTRPPPIIFRLLNQAPKLFDAKPCEGFKVSFMFQRLIEDAHRIL
jgi:hypothetical protein